MPTRTDQSQIHTHSDPAAAALAKLGELRSRAVSPGAGTSRAALAQEQRERLLEAAVAVVAERGYDETRVSDILERSGLSRSAFYKQFANKRECFLAAVEAVAARVRGGIVGAYREDLPWDERLSGALGALIDGIVADPAGARLWFVEVYAAGPEVAERMEAMRGIYEELAWHVVRESPDRADMPLDLVRAGLGGLRKVVMTRVRHGDEAELAELAPELMRWLLSYRPPPEPLRRPAELPPSSVWPAADDPDDTRARILAAISDLVAKKGYAAVAISDIARDAAISFSTFYSHFEGKDEAFIAALERARGRMRDSIVPAYAAAPSWPLAVGTAVHSLFAFLSTDPPTARLAGLESLANGAEALDVRDAALDDIRTVLARGFELHPDVPAIAAESIGASLSALVYDQIRRGSPDRIYELAPAAAYVALAPFIGEVEACKIANDPWGAAAEAG
jgi:AcrR family transcriptional regulator